MRLLGGSCQALGPESFGSGFVLLHDPRGAVRDLSRTPVKEPTFEAASRLTARKPRSMAVTDSKR